ncbi:MAG: DUF86 domain-containing protein [Thermoplasmata archaeon]
MLDTDRILAKLDELDSHLKELAEISPESLEEYKTIEKRRACEKLLHIAVECVIDICGIVVTNRRLGLPDSEEDLFRKLEEGKVISSDLAGKLRLMRGFRNIIVHRYGSVDDELVFETLRKGPADFVDFKGEILEFLKGE